jgi:uncharacterized membrane protein YcjF (UPF0283 family)
MATPVAWVASEFQERRWLRLVLGTTAILLCFGVAFVVGSLERLNSNAWFGSATKTLIDTTVTELEAGHHERVIQSLRELQKKYSPTYENRARYDHLVEETINQMRASEERRP